MKLTGIGSGEVTYTIRYLETPSPPRPSEETGILQFRAVQTWMGVLSICPT